MSIEAVLSALQTLIVIACVLSGSLAALVVVLLNYMIHHFPGKYNDREL